MHAGSEQLFYLQLFQRSITYFKQNVSIFDILRLRMILTLIQKIKRC